MRLDDDQLQAAYFCAARVIRDLCERSKPVPHWLQSHYDRLDVAMRVSESGHELNCRGAESEAEMLSTREAAAILGLSKRQTQRLAGDLDGRIVGGRWVFRKSVVLEFADGSQDGHSGPDG